MVWRRAHWTVLDFEIIKELTISNESLEGIWTHTKSVWGNEGQSCIWTYWLKMLDQKKGEKTEISK